MEKGQWIFTCSMQPEQFSHIRPKDITAYDKSWLTKSEEERNAFINDDFVTLKGSHHSKKSCSCKPISETYALWFIQNKCWELFPDNRTNEQWDEYEDAVKELCKRDNIQYEGI